MVRNTRCNLVNELKSDEFKLRFRTHDARTRKYTARPVSASFFNPLLILMLIHDAHCWYSSWSIAEMASIIAVSTGSFIKHCTELVQNLIFFFSFFFFCIHSYRFFLLIEILPFSQMLDVCLSSLLSCCLWTLTIFHWHRR